MQKPSRDKGFQRERDICLHFAHCPQLSNRFVFVFARVRPPRTRRRGARSNLGHCHPRHILGARQPGLQKAAGRLGERRPRRSPVARGRQGCGGGRSCARGRRGVRTTLSRRATGAGDARAKGGGEGASPASARGPFCSIPPPPTPGHCTFTTLSWDGREPQVANPPLKYSLPHKDLESGAGSTALTSHPQRPGEGAVPGKFSSQAGEGLRTSNKPNASWEPGALAPSAPLG